MLQDGAGLEPRATPRDLLRLYVAFHEGGPSAEDLIAQAGLRAVAATRVRRLSGGERQRLSLAIALAGDPEVLILDEPTAGMDPEARRQARELIAGLRDAGRSILLTTHDLGDVERLADRVAIMHRGRIVADAPPDELAGGAADGASQGGAASGVRFRVHAAPSAEALERLRSRLAATRPGLGLHGVAAERAGAPGVAFEIQPGAASADVVMDVAQWAAREGLLVTELHAGARSLEERYLELTGDRDVEDVV
jgi:ABC-2 type transport system ATP-binding protein